MTWLKRLAVVAGTLWFTLTLIFFSQAVIGKDPVAMFVDPRMTPTLQARYRQVYGFDQSLTHRYLRFLGNMARGELGLSFSHKQPVTTLLRTRLPLTIWLGLFSYLLATAFGLGLLWCLQQVHRPRLIRTARAAAALLFSTPSFVLAPLLLALLGYRLRLFPTHGSAPLFRDNPSLLTQGLDLIHHSLLPALCLALPLGAQFCAYLDEELSQLDQAPFLLSARGRGLSPTRIFLNHQLRVVRPVWIQLAGLYLPLVAGGALVIEAVFGWAGMGTLMFDAVLARDYPLLLGGCLSTAAMVLIGYECADELRSRSGAREHSS